MKKRLLAGGIGVVGLLLLLGVLNYRSGSRPEVAQKPAIRKAVKAAEPVALREESLPVVEEVPALEEVQPAEAAVEAVAGDTDAAAIIAKDPLKRTLKHALARFQNLKTYQFDMNVKVYADGVPLFETSSKGNVKDQNIVLGATEVDGEKVEVLAQGGQSWIRLQDEEEWTEIGGEEEAMQMDPRAMEMAQQLVDPILASMPLSAAGTEMIDGVACQGMRFKLDGQLPAEIGIDGQGDVAITFFVDESGNLRRWRLESEMSQEGQTVKTVADSVFRAFDEPWTVALPQVAGN